MVTTHLLISGKVQGVFYRASAKETADRLNLRGWIRNTKKGNVEALVTGDNPSVQAFITWCKTGPKNARVKEIKVSAHDRIDFEDFRISPSA